MMITKGFELVDHYIVSREIGGDVDDFGGKILRRSYLFYIYRSGATAPRADALIEARK